MKVTRRKSLQFAGLLATTGLAGCVGLGDDSGCTVGRTLHASDVTLPERTGWPTIQYDAANTGYNPDASGPKQAVEVAWRYGACTAAEGGAVVSGGRVYSGGLVVNGRTGTADGGEWHGHMSTPTVAGGTLFVGAHDLEARDPATGDGLWTFQTDTDAGSLPAPKVSGDMVYVPGSIGDSTVYAVDSESGEERWRFDAGADADTPVAVAAGTVYVVAGRDTVYALEGRSGDELWRVTHDDARWQSAPVVVDDTIYLGSFGGEVFASSTEDGSEAWRRQFGEPEPGSGASLAVADGTVFAAGDGTVVALDAATGEIGWRATTGPNSLLAPAVADGVVYVGDRPFNGPGTLFALNAATGDVLWRFETRRVLFGDEFRPGGVNASPAVVDGLVFVATAAGDLYALRER